MWNNIFKPMNMMQRGLSASWTRNAVIRNNIANIETPGFKASVVEFESLFAKALQDGGFVGVRTHPGHREIGKGTYDSVRPMIFQSKELSMRADGNNVDIESENVRMVQNSLYYNTLMEKLNGEIRRLRMAISEGR
ncbi:MAG: flagellar basal body rod protein FlgB [Oscillospiraceae bacterium]|jgi:flagellar basal-body rod protein FlgB|nr:flagellar basal body rod protein FlgB [Oscillospiraceae bacterium]